LVVILTRTQDPFLVFVEAVVEHVGRLGGGTGSNRRRDCRNFRIE